MLPDRRLRPHYYIYGASFALYGLLLIGSGAALPGLLVLGSLALQVVLTGRNRDAEALYYIISMNLFFFATKITIPLIRQGKADAALYALDQNLFAIPLNMVRALASPLLTDLLTVCYLLFGPVLLFSLLYYAFYDKKHTAAFYAGMFSCYGMGFFGYLLFPAEGPHFAYAPEVTQWLPAGPLFSFLDPLIKSGCTRSDAFPSLHVAVSLYILGFMRCRSRFWFRILLLPICGLCLATVYLQYHYVIDTIAGAALAGISLLMASAAGSREEALSRRRLVLPAETYIYS